jgi:hypothetical protein
MVKFQYHLGKISIFNILLFYASNFYSIHTTFNSNYFIILLKLLIFTLQRWGK